MQAEIGDRYPGLTGRPGEMAMLCALLRDRGLHADALMMGQAAVAAAPDSLAIAGQVRDVLSRGVDRFHRPMMLDHTRNRIYADAIARAVRPGMKVLEIGCGAGLLAMLAARAGAQVVTCEANPMIAAAATEIIRRNGLSDRIRVVAKRSTDLQIPEDLDEPADLVIHEVFGSALFDEGVTAAMGDARARLLKPGAPSIPPAAAIGCGLVRLDDLKPQRSLADIAGFDMSGFELLTRRHHHVGTADPGITFVAEPVVGLRMDYQSPPPFGPAAERFALPSRGGRIDGVLQWIKLEFDGGAVLENRPMLDGPRSSWGVACHVFDMPLETSPGDLIDVSLRHRGTTLMIDATRRAA